MKIDVYDKTTPHEDAEEMEVNLGLIRWSAGMTVDKLSAKSGVTASTIERVESGDHLPRLTTLCRLADALGVNLRDLLPLNGDEFALEAVQFAVNDMLNDLGATVAWYRGLMGS